ncbi:MAG: hypothetical protein R3D88_03845 [Alphaproteobacteria bacterium]
MVNQPFLPCTWSGLLEEPILGGGGLFVKPLANSASGTQSSGDVDDGATSPYFMFVNMGVTCS